jgi:hypothetical protein
VKPPVRRATTAQAALELLERRPAAATRTAAEEGAKTAPLFYLGAPHAHWLAQAGVPLFVSRRTLARVRKLPRASTIWALDSGAFTEIGMHGTWAMSALDYAREVRRYRDEVGGLAWAAPQDWACEPEMVRRTGLSVEAHQARTLANYLELESIAPDLPWMPVLQGWSLWDYLRHAETYEAAGVELASLPLVGVGTVCRRQSTTTATALLSILHAEGLRLHAFGFKVRGLRASTEALVSADSMAWSYGARRNPPMPGHEAKHRHCTGCLGYAMQWRSDLMASLGAAGGAKAA